jgi:hypothetical protein
MLIQAAHVLGETLHFRLLLIFFHVPPQMVLQQTLISAVYICHEVPRRCTSQTSYHALPRRVLQRAMISGNLARFLNRQWSIFDNATTNKVQSRREILEQHICVVGLPRISSYFSFLWLPKTVVQPTQESHFLAGDFLKLE